MVSTMSVTVSLKSSMGVSMHSSAMTMSLHHGQHGNEWCGCTTGQVRHG